jgi:Lambda phage tail tube protein, TTP
MPFESQAISSQGVLIKVSDGAVTPAFLDLCEIKTFNGFDGQASEVDVTTLCSEAKEMRLGLQDFGSFTFEMNYVPDDPAQVILQDLKAAGAPGEFKLVLPAPNGEWAFNAYVKSFPIAGGVDGVLTSSISLRITGAPVYTPGTLTAFGQGLSSTDKAPATGWQGAKEHEVERAQRWRTPPAQPGIPGGSFAAQAAQPGVGAPA